MLRRLARLLPLAFPLAACTPTPTPVPAVLPSPGFVVAPPASPGVATPPPGSAATLAPAVVTIAGGEDEGYQDGPGSMARFNTPLGLALGADGDLYVADSQNHRVRRIDLDDPAFPVTTLAGGGPVARPGEFVDGSFKDGPGSAARFYEPTQLVTAADGSFYVTDAFNHRIRRIVNGAGGVEVTTIAGSGAETSVDGLGTAASFRVPFGLAIDARGDLYVSDHWGQVVRRIVDPGGQAAVNTIAGTFDQPGYVDMRGTAARFEFPAGLAVDATGNVYVLETKGCHLRRIGPDLDVLTLNDTAPNACGYQDGDLEGGRLDQARLIAAVPGQAGFVMVAGDEGNRVLRRITVVNEAGDGTVETIAGTEARLDKPRGVVVGKDGAVYVADGHRIRRIKP